MVYMFEVGGYKKPLIEPETIEHFTNKSFKELIDESFHSKTDFHFVITKNTSMNKSNNRSNNGINKNMEIGKDNINYEANYKNSNNSNNKNISSSNNINNTQFICYDAKEMCKYLFEIQIADYSYRKIRIKNFKDPKSKKTMTDCLFYKIKSNSKSLMAEYVGDYKDFVDNSYLRSKIFKNENPFDCLSISFGSDSKKRRRRKDILKARQVFSVAISILLLIFVTTFVYLIFQRKYHLNGFSSSTTSTATTDGIDNNSNNFDNNRSNIDNNKINNESNGQKNVPFNIGIESEIRLKRDYGVDILK